jgi:hypothetical protein
MVEEEKQALLIFAQLAVQNLPAAFGHPDQMILAIIGCGLNFLQFPWSLLVYVNLSGSREEASVFSRICQTLGVHRQSRWFT